ncbi:diacylglycerol/lipid kinase family protein [Fundicoccus sp. Sow4_H7]|uniref:diacylglycerol/lipid kinase family protein n=1 Tax=Fundicoccus sp. Sow4_H7 TaxID=3438784 RepID=UPI003F8E9D0E
MSERIYIICHLNSGAGKGKDALEEVYRILNSYQITYLTYYTDYASHAKVITQQIMSKGFNPENQQILVLGGDGTLHEVVGAMIQMGLNVPIAYIATGTGNDFNRVWQPNKSIRQIIETMLFSRQVKTIPIFTFYDRTTNINDIVLNSLGFGFDAEVNYLTQQIDKKSFLRKYLDGHFAYLVSIFKSLNILQSFNLTIQVDGETHIINNAYLACIMNNPYFGGGIKLDNLASHENKELSLIIIHDVNFKAIISLLFSILIKQDQHLSPNVTRFTGDTMELKLNKAIRGQVDGEDLTPIQADLSIRLSEFPFYL